MKIKKGDTVKVVAGKDKGKTGAVEKVLEKAYKVLVLGVNQYKRHRKGNANGQASEILTITKPLPVANVMFVCPKCQSLARLGYGMENKKKIRICKKCGQSV